MAEKKQITERMYDVLVRPVVTEKSTQIAENNHLTFVVAIDATKPEIKQAVETLYKVTVEGVNTLTTKGKMKRTKGVLGRRSDVKKAIVKLADGQSVDIAAGV